MVSEFTGAHKKTKIEICGKPRKRLAAVKVLAIMHLPEIELILKFLFKYLKDRVKRLIIINTTVGFLIALRVFFNNM